jgi:hypothetical protein
MKTKLIWIFLCLLVVAVLAAGCIKTASTTQVTPQPSVTASSPPSTSFVPSVTAVVSPSASPVILPGVTPDLLTAKVTQSLSNVTSYNLNRTTSQLLSTKSDRSDQATSKIYSKEYLDVAHRSMQMSNAINFKQPSGQPQWPVIENRIYITGETMYIQGLFPDQPNKWSKTPVTPDIWLNQNQAQLLASFMLVQNIVSISQEAISSGDSNITCYVVKINPELNKFWSFVINQPGLQLAAAPPEGLSLEQIVRSSGMNLWIDPASGLILKADFKVSVSITPEILPSFTNNYLSEISATLLFDKYNQPLDIMLPSEAVNAVDLSSLKKP